ncbi:MAG: hypothetical protein HYU66_14235 [Armatimonadetes bacterium]|nr:hypothetical protein [Armatimonadota bacterium]
MKIWSMSTPQRAVPTLHMIPTTRSSPAVSAWAGQRRPTSALPATTSARVTTTLKKSDRLVACMAQ